jgi:hypothetical protein
VYGNEKRGEVGVGRERGLGEKTSENKKKKLIGRKEREKGKRRKK